MTIEKSIVKNFILKTMLFSTIITFPFIFGNMLFEYQNEIRNINHSFDQFEKSGLDSLTQAVWFLDRNQMNQQIDGLAKTSPFANVKLEALIVGNINKKSELPADGPVKTFKLIHEQNVIGTITISSSLTPLYSILYWRFFLIFSSVILNTALVAGFILFVFKKDITEPLNKTTDYIRKITFDQSELLHENEYINDFKSSAENLNELEKVNHSIGQLQHNFQNSYFDLLKTKERLNDILNFSSKAIFETDKQFTLNLVSYANDNMENGLDVYLKINKSLLDLPISEEDIEEIKNKRNIIEINSSNNDYHYNIILKANYDNDLNFVGYRGIVFDVTDKINNENKIKNQNEQIQQMQKTGAIGELTASLAHDFRNFISIIIYTYELLIRRSKDPEVSLTDEKIQQHLKNALDASMKADALITKMLTFSRRHASNPEKVNLYQQVKNMQELLQVALTKKYLLTINTDENLYECMVDTNIFESAILNLCVNAKDALKNTGEVKIEFSNVHIENNSKVLDGDFVLLKFTDNGYGMSPDVQKRIFEPFFTTKEIGKGTGLGLSMIHNFVINANGFIDVQSVEGLGTSFFLYFPKA